MLDDVKRIEKNPERMRRIRQSPVSECIAGQQVAELVVNLGLRHRQPRQERHTSEDRCAANGRYGKSFLLGKIRELEFTQTEVRPGQGDSNYEKSPAEYSHYLNAIDSARVILLTKPQSVGTRMERAGYHEGGVADAAFLRGCGKSMFVILSEAKNLSVHWT
jgi:hypothetical protein